MTLATFLSSFIPSAACDAPEEKEEKVEAELEKTEADEGEDKEESKVEGADAEEEEEEPELVDPLVTLREDCQESAACAKYTKHFAHCQEKVEAGEGFKGEDCVEEMFHMMHCVDNCVAPRLFAKLK
ncbi:hypothetical protein EW145_g3550 [Phellinidium pouzarii]|uniref:Ubiquinol-cytochrome C reductase hinge domain-containing protein n=1 Tax=Phellinidium pouzarii TaxID=167371 RepID=A0A4V3XCU1_9AGAM|nr:hypothetical protein EW145_g3550 [Phellinidium pouzarii]